MSEVPVNNAGTGANVAGLDTNPPVPRKKKKKLRDVVRR